MNTSNLTVEQVELIQNAFRQMDRNKDNLISIAVRIRANVGITIACTGTEPDSFLNPTKAVEKSCRSLQERQVRPRVVSESDGKVRR